MMKSKNLLSLYFFVIFIYTATPCNILSLVNYSGNIYTAIFPILFTLFMCLKFKVKLLDVRFLSIIGVLCLWNLIHLICTPNFKISPFPFLEVLIAYTIVSIYSKDLFVRFENVAVFLSKVALVGWVLCLISHSTMLNFAYLFGSPGAKISQSLYIFSVPLEANNVGFLLRNCGFSWEPGRFSCILILALFFNIVRTNFKISDKNFLILLAALISAQSTTGYIVFIIMISIYYLMTKKINFIYIAIAALLVVLVSTLPFMRDKILDLFSNSQDFESQVNEMIFLSKQGSIDGYYVPQRFDGMMFQLINLEHAPLLIGEGRDLTFFYLNKTMGFQIAVSEGLLSIIIQYGIIIALCSYYMVFKSSRIFCTKCSFLFFVIFIMINFSYSLWEPPLIMALWMFGYFSKIKKINYATNFNRNTIFQQ